MSGGGVKQLISNHFPAEQQYEKLIKVKDYYLAFRGTAGVGNSMFAAYTRRGNDDTKEARVSIPCSCLDLKSKKGCDRHYKSRIISLWNVMDIRQVG